MPRCVRFTKCGEVDSRKREIAGEIREIDGTPFYVIENYDHMPPFLISVASAYDHWLFVSTSGNLTAGRVSPDDGIFPYVTDDRLHEYGDFAGGRTVFLVSQGDQTFLWRPFCQERSHDYTVTRSVGKSVYGNVLWFEEVNETLGLCSQTRWQTSNQHGFIKESALQLMNAQSATVDVLDGLINILPPGTKRELVSRLSPLMDAYKMGELYHEQGLATYHLSSIFSGNPEPVEALEAVAAYAYGLSDCQFLLSTKQVANFCQGKPIASEDHVKGIRPAFLVSSQFTLNQKEQRTWGIVIDSRYTGTKVEALKKRLAKKDALVQEIHREIEAGTRRLIGYIERADGLHDTGDQLSSYKHVSNVMFNIMRGGIYVDGYRIQVSDFAVHLETWNRAVHEQYRPILGELGDATMLTDLLTWAQSKNDASLLRLTYEFLPLSFSRRHGDPSRPWNGFVIHVQDECGRDRIHYQGNWRDIFQNWEALSISYPGYIENIIVKFANGITADGYNAIGVSSQGVSWEEIKPEQEMTRVGYSGDHQVIYLVKMLELLTKYYPGRLDSLLNERVCVYPNVPYRIKPFEDLVVNPRRSLYFDHEAQMEINHRVRKLGSDGKLHRCGNGEIVTATLLEKILSILLSKLSNFVPGGGIWMNTQRPEWNDANSALVGWGLSGVTLCYVRRFMAFLLEETRGLGDDCFELSTEMARLFSQIHGCFREHKGALRRSVRRCEREAIWRALSEIGSTYRMGIYRNGFEGEIQEVRGGDLHQFCVDVLTVLDQTIAELRRDDDLYHAYSLIELDESGLNVRRLTEMLEGQVAVLASGALETQACVRLLKALRSSRLYREDQRSYILYPDKKLPEFVGKTQIDEKVVASSSVLQRELATGDGRIVVRDVNGRVHFSSRLPTIESLLEVLEGANSGDRDELLRIYKESYRHDEFLGRSQVVFKYEGLGSIYWHMVSKLLLEVQGVYFKSKAAGEDPTITQALYDSYYDIRQGLSHEKSPEVYGAFVLDAYSHTPSFCGAQQPGMTGQVKEDVLSRFGELGVVVEAGQIRFEPHLLRDCEWKDGADLSLSVCGVPVEYRRAGDSRITVHLADGSMQIVPGNRLDPVTSERVFDRDPMLRKIVCELPVR